MTFDVSTGTNVLFRVPVPGLAHSSPIVVGDDVYLTTVVRKTGESELSSLFGAAGYGRGDSVPEEGEHVFWVLAFDRRTGRRRWATAVHEGVPKTKRHPKSTHGNPTPAAASGRIVVSFGSEGLHCLDRAGKVLWSRDLGVLDCGAPGVRGTSRYQWGFASSPVIHDGRVFVQCDHEGQSFVACFDLATGREVWTTMRIEDSTWCTPTVCDDGPEGRPQLVCNGYKHIGGYDLETGRALWSLSGGGDVPVPTPVIGHGLIFLSSAHGRSRPLRAVSVRARGRLAMRAGEEPFIVWSQPRRGVYMQTPIVVGDLLFACSDAGALGCYVATTGEELFRERVGGGMTGFSASPVEASGRLYLTGESGYVAVVAVGRTFRLLAESDLGEACLATPAIAGDVIYFRTRSHLLAVGHR